MRTGSSGGREGDGFNPIEGALAVEGKGVQGGTSPHGQRERS